mgnify:CR=1 FL=1
MTGLAPLPPNPANPIGGTALITAARRDVNRSLAATRRWLLDQLAAIPVTRIEVNSSPQAPLAVNASTYEYIIDTFRLKGIVDELRRRLGGTSEPVVSRAVSGYEIGTAAEVTALGAITQDYTRTVMQVLASDPWQRRVALVRARVFEEMEGFVGETATDLARVLSNGVEGGFNPITVAKDITARFGVAQSRAERISRTEITGALRRARWDEAEDAAINVGVRTMQMHLSALSPTTRETHARRHGNLYTVQEVREWYAQDGNGINCKCAQAPVLVDAEGKPVIDRQVKRAKALKEKYFSEQQ